MNAKQKSVLVLGALLLLLNFVFPYTSYPVWESSEPGIERFGVDTTFMPIWSAREAHERAPLKGNPWSDTIVLWGMVAKFAAGIVVVSSSLCFLLRSRPPKSTDNEKASGSLA